MLARPYLSVYLSHSLSLSGYYSVCVCVNVSVSFVSSGGALVLSSPDHLCALLVVLLCERRPRMDWRSEPYVVSSSSSSSSSSSCGQPSGINRRTNNIGVSIKMDFDTTTQMKLSKLLFDTLNARTSAVPTYLEIAFPKLDSAISMAKSVACSRTQHNRISQQHTTHHPWQTPR